MMDYFKTRKRRPKKNVRAQEPAKTQHNTRRLVFCVLTVTAANAQSGLGSNILTGLSLVVRVDCVVVFLRSSVTRAEKRPENVEELSGTLDYGFDLLAFGLVWVPIVLVETRLEGLFVNWCVRSGVRCHVMLVTKQYGGVVEVLLLLLLSSLFLSCCPTLYRYVVDAAAIDANNKIYGFRCLSATTGLLAEQVLGPY